jgi:hypothetical protein
MRRMWHHKSSLWITYKNLDNTDNSIVMETVMNFQEFSVMIHESTLTWKMTGKILSTLGENSLGLDRAHYCTLQSPTSWWRVYTRNVRPLHFSWIPDHLTTRFVILYCTNVFFLSLCTILLCYSDTVNLHFQCLKNLHPFSYLNTTYFVYRCFSHIYFF